METERENLQREFRDHMGRCGRCGGDNSKRCWQTEDMLKELAKPNEIEIATIYDPNPQIDGDFPPLRLVTCPFCLNPIRLERRGGQNALGYFVPPYYVDSKPVHECFYDVPRKTPVKKSAKTQKRRPVTWSTAELF